MQISRHWRLNSQRYSLQGVVCPHCAANIFPPREVCPYCEGKAESPFRFEQDMALRVEAKAVAAQSAAAR